MTQLRPEFHLCHVDPDGNTSEPTIYKLVDLPSEAQMGRRGFLGAGVAVAAVVSSLAQTSAAFGQRGRRRAGSRVVIAHRGSVYSLAISPDGKRLASASHDQTIKIWEIPGGKLLKTLQPVKGAALSVAFSPNGELLASGSSRGEGQIWKLADGKESESVQGRDGVGVVAFTPKGDMAAFFDAGQELRLMEIPSGKVIQTYRGLEDAIQVLRMWNVPEPLRDELIHPRTFVTAFHITLAGAFLAYASKSLITVWRLPGGEQIERIQDHRGRVYALAMTPDGDVLASAATDRIIKVRFLSQKTRVTTIRGFSDWPLALALTPDGNTLVSGHADGTIVFWDTRTGEQNGFCFDRLVNWVDGVTFELHDSQGGYPVVYTLPCGSPIPKGAQCICNCVPGVATPPTPPVYIPPVRINPPVVRIAPPRTQSVCSCVPVCTCIPVFR